MINTTAFKTATVPGAAVTGRAENRPPERVYIDFAHHLPGRPRLKAASFKRNARAIVKARRALAGIDGVTSVAASLCTGSLLVRYDPNIVSAGDLVKVLAEHGYVTAPVATPGQNADGQGGDGWVAHLIGAILRLLADALVERATVALIAALI